MSDRLGLQLREALSKFVRHRVSSPADAEDLIQDILLKVISNPGPAQADKQLYWVFAVARNRVTDYYRSSRRQFTRVSVEEVQLSADEQREVPAIKEALSGVLGEMIGQLSDRDQDALRAVDLEGMSQKEYASNLGIDYTSAKSRVQRARKRLRRVLEQCCSFELDRRGTPIACEPKKDNECC